MRVGYARVSTQKAAQDVSIEGQVAQLEAAGCDRVIVERLSASNGRRRPGWDELWAVVGGGAVRSVVVVDQSRLSRSGDDLQFLELCALHGVEVETLLGGRIEVETPGGFLAAGVLSVVSRAQSRVISSKTRDGLRRRREAGAHACGKTPFGYRYDRSSGRVFRDEVNWEAARAMWDQLAALDFNVSGWIRQSGMPWSPPGLKRWIHNPILRGIVRGTSGATEALISGTEYHQAVSALKVRAGLRGRASHRVHLFTGIIRCSGCGKTLHTVRERAKMRLKCKSPHCARYGQGIAVAEARRSSIAALCRRAKELAAAAGPEAEGPEVAACRLKIEGLESLISMGVEGLGDALAREQRALHELLVATREQDASLLEQVFSDPASLEPATDEELRTLLQAFVKAIEWLGGLDGDIALVFRFQ